MTTITLSKPVANGPELIKSLTWRAVRLGDSPALMKAFGSLVQVQLGEFADDLLDLVARFSGLPRSVVDTIDEVDGQLVLESLEKHLAAHMAKLKK